MSGMLDKTDLFKYAAASYLCWWVKNDRDYFGWNDLTEEKLKKFLTLYSVRRTIPGNDLSAFISIIEAQRGIFITPGDAPRIIREACRSVEIKHNRPCLSAVSKILWMMHGDPIAMYDSRARGRLQQITKEPLIGYDEYYACWVREFGRVDDKIRKAQAWLPMASISRRLERYGVATGRELRSWIGQPWFVNRIFDQWLLHSGSEWTKARSSAVDVALMLDPAEARV